MPINTQLLPHLNAKSKRENGKQYYWSVKVILTDSAGILLTSGTKRELSGEHYVYSSISS